MLEDALNDAKDEKEEASLRRAYQEAYIRWKMCSDERVRARGQKLLAGLRDEFGLSDWNSEYDKRLGKLIRDYRKAEKLTIRELAERCKLEMGIIRNLDEGMRSRHDEKIWDGFPVAANILSAICEGMQLTKAQLVEALTPAYDSDTIERG